MSNTYNVKISFKGEGNLSFVLPGYGELTIYNKKDIFVKGLTVNGVEALRQLRPLLLDHQLNAKPDGCYKVIDLTNTNIITPKDYFERSSKEPTKSVAELKASMIKSNGPIIEEIEETQEEIEETQEEIEEIEEIEESKEEENIEPEVKTPKSTKPSAAKTTAKRQTKRKKR
jgi:DNA-binding protein H-NS